MDQSEVKHLPKVDHTPAEMDDAHRRLLKAAAFLETWGHIKGHVMQVAGYCAIGAIIFCESNSSFFEAELLLGNNLDERWQQHPNPVAAWNDAPETTTAEVIAKMRSVALGL